jgi:hypothetical protein
MMCVLLIGVLVAGLLLINLVFWLEKFVELMLMPDEDFPGRHDKALWVLVFIVFFFLVAPAAFSRWREGNLVRLRRLRLEAAGGTRTGQQQEEAPAPSPQPQEVPYPSGITSLRGSA